MDEYKSKPKMSKPAVDKPEAYKNISNVVVYVCGQRVKPGGSYEPTAGDKAQERNMQRIAHAVKLGLIEKV